MAIDLINAAIEYEQQIEYFSGPMTRRQAEIIKRFTTKDGFRIRVKDSEKNEFNLECPNWMYKKAAIGMRVEFVYQLVKGEPDEYREKLLGIKRLSTSGKRPVPWAV